MREASWLDSFAGAAELVRRYALLEGRMRRLIDRVTARVCPGCTRPCCRAHYCRETSRNPWYRAVNRITGGYSPPPDWAQCREPFALGGSGCRLRAGRYVFCYSYNCPSIRQFVEGCGVASRFQELSELLLAANRLPGGRLLHEVRRDGDVTHEDLQHIGREVDRSLGRLADLELPLEAAIDRNATARGRQAECS